MSTYLDKLGLVRLYQTHRQSASRMVDEPVESTHSTAESVGLPTSAPQLEHPTPSIKSF